MHAGKNPSRPGEVPIRVLVLDDEPLIRWAAATTLAGAGLQVIEAASAAGALEVVDTMPLDLALLDVRLPDGDGVDVLNELHRVQPGCRCIMMTAFRTPELTHHAAADDVPILDKPFGMPDLLGLVEAVIGSRA
jgi:DNA-binding NtrC family response regulator